MPQAPRFKQKAFYFLNRGAGFLQCYTDSEYNSDILEQQTEKTYPLFTEGIFRV